MKREILCLGAAVVAVNLCGCATRSNDRGANLALSVLKAEPLPRPKSQEAVGQAQPPVREGSNNAPAASPQPPPSAPPPPRHDPETPARRVAAYLPQGCIATEVSDRELLVRSSTATRAPSLYEESISLSRLRGQLKSRPGVPAGTADQSSLKDGTATILFTGPLPPAEAAGVISSALSLDAVQRVRVVLAP